jgi:PBS lyase HEAT-like repeat
VQPTSNGKQGSGRRWPQRLAWAASVSLGLCGCANFWDEVTSRDFSPGSLFVRKDPMVVLRDSGDGYERSKALATLQEPLQHGGSAKDQETIVAILKTVATSDQDQLCRLSAIETLGRFKDPRAAEILDSVYLQNLPFRENNGYIREQCLRSLAETGGPIALQRLVVVAKEPPASGDKADPLETLDRRVTAVRGLAKFKDPAAATALAQVLKSEKDTALRDCAYQSIQDCTGKRLPPDSPQWAVYLTPGGPENVQPAGGVPPGSVVSPTGWNGKQ